MSKNFSVGDRVVHIYDNELIAGTLTCIYNNLCTPTVVVEDDEGTAHKLFLSSIAHAPVNEVQAEERDTAKMFAVMLGALTILDKIVSTVCDPVPYGEPDYE